ncbi:MAG: TauD/TfdA dioxygenase family protein [Burkholderiales bacterium]
MQILKLTPTIGAEILDVDLSAPLSEPDFEQIRRALLEHQVIFFRDQRLSIDEHKAFGRRFGPLHIHPNAPKALPEHPEVLVIKADEHSKRVAGEVWHSDVSCDAEPPMGSILYLTQIPENGGGDTSFVNMVAAYEALSPALQTFLTGLTAIHSSEKSANHRYRDKTADMTFPENEHPVVRTHPETGRRALYVNRGFTTRIPQLTADESKALLDLLFEHSEQTRFQCRFKWRPNSIAFWDNRATMHQAMWDYYPQKRYGHRITIQGDRPFLRL